MTVNDWCIDLPTGALDVDRAQAMLRAYRCGEATHGHRGRVAGHAPCGRAALLGIASVGLFPAARGRHAPAARSDPLRTHPAPPSRRRRTAPLDLIRHATAGSSRQEGYVWFRQGIWLFRKNPLAFLMLLFIYLTLRSSRSSAAVRHHRAAGGTPGINVGVMTACHDVIQSKRVLPTVPLAGFRSNASRPCGICSCWAASTRRWCSLSLIATLAG